MTDHVERVTDSKTTGATITVRPVPERAFGRTGETIPLLGLGTAPAGSGLEERDAIRLFHSAIDMGVRYLDTAPGYGDAQRRLAEVLRTRRDEVFLVTKTPTADRGEAIAQLEDNLRVLGVDSVDLTLLHDLGPRDVDQVLSGEGALAGLQDARDRGLTRYIGFSAHSRPNKALRVIQESRIDAVLLATNFVDRYTYDFDSSVVPEAAARGIAVIGMKAFGGAPDMNYKKPTASALARATERGDRDATRFEIDYHDLALRYAMTLAGVSSVIVGCFSEADLRFAYQRAADLVPLSPHEEDVLAQHGRRIAGEWGPHFGPVE